VVDLEVTRPGSLFRCDPFWGGLHRLTPGAVNTWDLLKKDFIQRYCPPSKTAKRLEYIHNFKQESDESLYQAWERYNDLLYKCPTYDINIPQKGTLSRNISSNSDTDGLAAVISKLDNLRRDMKKLKENVHLEEVKYGEFRCSTPFNGSNGAKFCVGPSRYYTRTDNRPPYGEKRPSLEELMKNHQEESARRSAEMKEWITNVTPSSSTEQCKVVNDDYETQHKPISSRNLNNKEEWTTKDIRCQLPPKELNPENFTLPCSIGNFKFYGMADLGASVNVMSRNTFEYDVLSLYGSGSRLDTTHGYAVSSLMDTAYWSSE
ncbi:cysteine-rich receptor-like protein kinase, partial [Tanacetum coccineum]